jgi:alpha-L-fucosidase
MRKNGKEIRMFCPAKNGWTVFLLALAVTATVPGASAQTFEATWESLGQYRCPAWFRDAKLGIFLHWGPTSVPAVDGWYGRNMYVQGHPAYEYHKLEGIKPEPWQTDTSVNGPWFYERGGRYVTPNDVIDMLADIVSKNGNLLLNIPLMADGTLDAASERILTEMGRWMDVNREAIQGTRPWLIYGEGPTTVKDEYSEEIKEAFTSKDFRFTTKNGAIYVIGLDWPAETRTVVVQSLAAGQNLDKIGSVRLLGFGGLLKWERVTEGLKVELPEKKPCEHAYVLKIAGDK